MTSNERRLYVRGVLGACAQFKAADSIISAVCHELGLTAEDMEKFITEEREAIKLMRASKKQLELNDLSSGGGAMREVR